MTENFPRVPISYDSLKSLTRCGLSSEARLYWWPYFPSLTKGDDINDYPKIGEAAVNRYKWARKIAFNESNDIEDDKESSIYIRLLMTLLVEQYRMDEIALVEPLIALIVRFIPLKDLSFYICCEVLDKPSWYINPNAANHRAKLLTFKELVHSHLSRSVYKKIKHSKGFEDEALNPFFVELFSTLLPIPYLGRVLDSFLLQGNKIIFRFGLSFLHSYEQFINSNEFIDMNSLWSYARSQTQNMTEEIFNSLSNYAYKYPKSFPRNMILNLDNKSLRRLGNEGRTPLGLKPTIKQQLLPDRDSEELRNMSHILSEDTSVMLRSYLPATVLMRGLDPVFSNTRDGSTLFSLYEKTSNRSPVLLLLRLAEGTGILGAYLSTALSPPSTAIRGDGHTFIFRLDDPYSVCYRWGEGTETGTGSELGNISTQNQFAMCTNDFISFGASAEHCGFALHIDSELKYVTSGPSDTYGNTASLVPELSQLRYMIRDIEVFCGHIKSTESPVENKTDS